MLQYLVKLVGSEKVALGSDYPFPLGEDVPGALIESCRFDDRVTADLLHGAALEWLDLDKSNFVS
jgi:aminocarboxymuconate-semialdehyde decarboxylase